MLVGLHGLMGVGKDTVAAIWAETHGMRRVALADPLREMLYELDPMLGDQVTVRMLVDRVGWDAAKRHRLHGPEVRRLLQTLATEVIRDMISATAFTDLAERHIHDLRETGEPVVVTDVRFSNEAGMIRRLGGYIVSVVRPGTAEPGSGHRSEASGLPCDLVLFNDGDLVALRRRAVDTIEHLLGGQTQAIQLKEISA